MRVCPEPMIHYQLVCTNGHSFDGWFRDSAGFERQAASGLVACPDCATTSVSRALMAPAIRKSTAVVDQTGRADPVVAPVPVPQVAGIGLPDQVRAVLQRLRAEVERTCEHVGDRFAEEARAIHNGTAAARGIYGESTPEQAEALAEEGIEVTRIPWLPRADS